MPPAGMLGRVRTMGVEEELMLFTGSGSPRPAPAGEELASDPGTAVEHEFKLEQAEIASEPATDLAALLNDLYASRRELIDSAWRRGLRVAALGTSPLSGNPTPTPDERYLRMHEHFGLVAGDQLACGMHVHVSVASRAEGVMAIDGIRSWLPVLIALTANSPFWSAHDSGYASYRSISWGRWPTAGATECFGDERGYDAAVEALVAVGAAIDDGMIYFDARLSAKYPTVEIRVADVAQRVGDSALVAALCRALVDTAAHAALGSREPPISTASVRAASWRAARFGLTGELVDLPDGKLRPAADVLDRLIDAVAPALRAAGDLDFVRTGVARVMADGTGADLQRGDLDRRGLVADVVDAAVRRTAASP